MVKKILVRGPALSMSGYGTQARYALRALRSQSNRFDIYLLNTPWGKTGWIWDDSEERKWLDPLIQKTHNYTLSKGQYDMSLQICIPNEWQKLAPINIGYTAGIETTKISQQWFQGCLGVDKMLLTSNHAKFGFINTQYPAIDNATGKQFMAKLDLPMEITPYCVNVQDPKKIELDLKYDFNFLVVAQWIPRKNIENTIKWFLEEFLDKEVGLVLKLNSINNSLMDREMTTNRVQVILSSFPNRKCAIHLLHGDLTEDEMTYVYKHPKIKALISLASGEGFGLPLFEAIYNGLPVIAPAWGGQNDFIYMPLKDKKTNKVKNTCMIANVSYDMKPVQPEAVWEGVILPDSQWCYPHEWNAKSQFRNVYKSYAEYKSKALKLQNYILEKFSAEKMYAHFTDCIDENFNVINISDFMEEENVVNREMKEVVQYA